MAKTGNQSVRQSDDVGEGTGTPWLTELHVGCAAVPHHRGRQKCRTKMQLERFCNSRAFFALCGKAWRGSERGRREPSAGHSPLRPLGEHPAE